MLLMGGWANTKACQIVGQLIIDLGHFHNGFAGVFALAESQAGCWKLVGALSNSFLKPELALAVPQGNAGWGSLGVESTTAILSS